MDSDNFFGFDASIPLDEEELDDEYEYDALNDETFGSAAVGGDWEEKHKQLSSLTEAERLRRSIGKDVVALSSKHNENDYRLKELHDNEDLRRTLECLSLDKSSEKKRLFERSVGSSPLINPQKDELSSSPGNSIWSPTVGLEAFENLRQLNKPNMNSPSQFNSFATQTALNGPHLMRTSSASVLPDFSLGLRGNIPPSVKTVSELEDELKRQYSNHHQGIKYPTMTVEDLERELSRQAMNSRKANSVQLSSSFPSSRLPSTSFQSSLPQQFINITGSFSATPSASLHSHPAGSKSLGNVRYPHSILNTIPNKVMPPGFVNNPSHMPNRPVGPFNHQMNHRMPLNKGFFHGGLNHGRNNVSKSSDDKRNFDQNFRYEQTRNIHEKNNGHGRNRVRRDSDAEWEEWQRIRQADEYSGLMTPREKGWLRNIQAMQLQTENPYQDDYYYVMHSVKQQRKREEEVIEINGLQLLLADKGKEGKEYEPPKLENSLGKLQVASVNAPRKIIDLQVVHLDSSHPTTTLQRDMRKHRYLLLHIEKLYNIHIELDDLERKIRALPDCPTRDSFRSKCRQLVSKLWTGLVSPHESFVQLLCIKKGKTLAAYLLSWVSQSEIEHLLATVVQNLSLLTKRDSHDKRLPLFWSFADRFFSVSPTSTIVSFGIMMGVQLKPQKNQFIPAIVSKLGLSMVLSLLVRGEELWNELEKDEVWQQFLKDVVFGLCSLSGKNDANVQPLPSVTLAASRRHPSIHLMKCKEIEPSALNRAIEVLKTFEVYLTKNTPAGLSSSSFSGVPCVIDRKSQSPNDA